LGENFYRNGALIFGGGNVLLPLMYTEFVEFKQTITSHQYLNGLAMVQVMPGPVFALTSYIGLVSMQKANVWMQLAGAISGVMIFLPGTFLIFFVSKFWNQVKDMKLLKLALQGINAVSCGLMVAAVILLLHHFDFSNLSIIVLLFSLTFLFFTKVPPYLLVISGIVLGLYF
jgi:chromate transporter